VVDPEEEVLRKFDKQRTLQCIPIRSEQYHPAGICRVASVVQTWQIPKGHWRGYVGKFTVIHPTSEVCG